MRSPGGRHPARKKSARRVGPRRKRGPKKPLLQDPDICNEEEALTQVSDTLHVHERFLVDHLRTELLDKTYEIQERITEFAEKEMQDLRDYFEKALDSEGEKIGDLAENIQVRRDEVKYQREEAEESS